MKGEAKWAALLPNSFHIFCIKFSDKYCNFFTYLQENFYIYKNNNNNLIMKNKILITGVVLYRTKLTIPIKDGYNVIALDISMVWNYLKTW